MDLEVLEAYSQAKVDVYKMNCNLIELSNEIGSLKEQLRNSKSKYQLKEYFDIYGTDGIFIRNDKKEELINLLTEKEI